MPRKKLTVKKRKANVKASLERYYKQREAEYQESIRRAAEVEPEGKGTNGAARVFKVMQRIAK